MGAGGLSRVEPGSDQQLEAMREALREVNRRFVIDRAHEREEEMRTERQPDDGSG